MIRQGKLLQLSVPPLTNLLRYDKMTSRWRIMRLEAIAWTLILPFFCPFVNAIAQFLYTFFRNIHRVRTYRQSGEDLAVFFGKHRVIPRIHLAGAFSAILR